MRLHYGNSLTECKGKVLLIRTSLVMAPLINEDGATGKLFLAECLIALARLSKIRPPFSLGDYLLISSVDLTCARYSKFCIRAYQTNS